MVLFTNSGGYWTTGYLVLLHQEELQILKWDVTCGACFDLRYSERFTLLLLSTTGDATPKATGGSMSCSKTLQHGSLTGRATSQLENDHSTTEPCSPKYTITSFPGELHLTLSEFLSATKLFIVSVHFFVLDIFQFLLKWRAFPPVAHLSCIQISRLPPAVRLFSLTHDSYFLM